MSIDEFKYILDNKKGYILKKKSNPFICKKFDIALLYNSNLLYPIL